MRRRIAAAVLATIGFASPTWSIEPVSSTLCAISGAPERYVGLLVRVHARVISDGLERTVLVDVAPKCRYGGATFSVASGVNNPGIEKIKNTIFSGRNPGTRNKFIRGDFVGIFRLTSAMPHMREVEIQSVSNLKVTLFGDERP
jgi:hypothetical protein